MIAICGGLHRPSRVQLAEGDWPCGEHPEGFQLQLDKGEVQSADQAGTNVAGKIFVNVADERSVKVLDLRTHKVLACWPLPIGLAANFPMFHAQEAGLLYIGTG